MRKHGAINNNMPNPAWSSRTKKRRTKNKLAKASRRRNR